MATRQNLSEKKISMIRNELQNKVGSGAANGFAKAENKLDWLERHWKDLEEYEGWNDKFDSVDDLTLSPEKEMEKIYNKNQNFDSISEEKMKSILKNSDFTKEDLKKYYQFRDDQKRAVEEFNRQRYEDAKKNYGQATRANDDSYFNSKVANELARKAYIEGDPTKAKYQEVAGKLAGAADFAPLPFSILGPGIRVGQKIYAGETPEVLSTGLDFLGAILPDYVEKPAKLGYQIIKSKLGNSGRVIEKTKFMQDLEKQVNMDEIEAARKAADAEIEMLKKVNPDKLTESQLLDLYNKTNNPAIKAKIDAIHKARGQKSQAVQLSEHPAVQANRSAKKEALEKKAEAENAVEEANKAYNETVRAEEPAMQLRSGKPTVPPYSEAGDINPFFGNVNLEDLSKYQTMISPASNKAKLAAIGLSLGGRKAERSLFHQDQKYDFMPKDTREADIKWLINTYGKTWSPLVPPDEAAYDPLTAEAYERWLKDPNMSYENWLKKENKK